MWIFKKFSIRIQFLGFMLLFTLLPIILISTTLNNYYITLTDEMAREYVDAAYIEMNNIIEEYSYYIKAISNQLLAFNPIYNIMLDESVEENEKVQFFNKTVHEFIPKNTGICGVEIIVNGKNYYYSVDGVPNPHIPDDEFLSNCSRTYIYIDKKTVSAGDKNYLVLGQRMYNFYSSTDIGHFILYVDEEELWRNYKDMILENSLVYITVDDYVISHSDKSVLGSKVVFPYLYNVSENNTDFWKTENSFIISNEVNTSLFMPRLKTIQLLATDNVFYLADLVQRRIAMLSLIAILIAVLLAIFIPRQLLMGLSELKKSMLLYASGRMSGITFSMRNETIVLEESFRKMIDRIEALNDANQKKMQQNKEAEINALSSQINPHFIYNALDTAVWTLKLGNVENTEKLLRDLGVYFRIGLHKGAIFITIADELKHVKTYLEIESMRHMSKKFDVYYDISPDIMQSYTLKILLQPMVENSIKHGFKNIKSGGIILIKGYEDDNGDICFSVEDNGCGCSENPILLNKTAETESGYGLKNINDRLLLEYGEGYGLKFSKSSSGGLCINFKIKRIDECPKRSFTK